MSVESAVAFYEKLETDLQLQERIGGVSDKEELAKLVKDDLGYEFTEEEMQKVIFEGNPELTDEEMEVIAGGQSTASVGCRCIGKDILNVCEGMGSLIISAAAAAS